LNVLLMHRIDREYTAHPFYGYRKMLHTLREGGHAVNKKRVQRLMGVMGLRAMTPGPHTSRPAPDQAVYPYRLRGVKVEQADQVWSCDITYLPLAHGYLYLFAVIDWYSRFVLSWRLSNTLEVAFCLDGLEEALGRGKPEIFNTDQGSQFTSREFTGRLLSSEVTISMDGRGRALDNVFVERLWRSVKYEDVYLKGYETPREASAGLGDYFRFYNGERPHQALDYRTPAALYQEGRRTKELGPAIHLIPGKKLS
jgi:putative transposase